MLIELLRAAAASTPDHPFLLTPGSTWSWGRFFDETGRLARVLAERAPERFACHVRDSAELVSLLCAAAWIPRETCIFSRDFSPEQVAALAADLDFPAVVADAPLDVAPTRTLLLSDLLEARDRPGVTPLPDPATGGPVLILTTGTTGRPKGARYHWRTLVRPTHRRSAHHQTRWLLAYNLNQFGGIQILIHVIASGASLVIPSSHAMADAIAAIEQFGVTHVSATPTFWRFLAAQLDETKARRLPLTHVTLGGEAVPARLLEDLGKLFPQARFSQIYGATEFGTGISVRDRQNGLPASILDRDESSEIQFRIQDGELFVRSTCGMIGYYGKEESPAGEWRPTGDLVELRGDRIHFVGRASDTINVGGVKVHPLPIEDRVAGLEGVQAVRAYGRANPVTGQIVMLDVVAAPDTDRAALEAAVRRACESLPRASQPRAVRFVDSIETRGRKIVRGTT